VIIRQTPWNHTETVVVLVDSKFPMFSQRIVQNSQFREHTVYYWTSIFCRTRSALFTKQKHIY